MTEVEEALAWLGEIAHENLGTEIALRGPVTGQIGFARRADGHLAGVSVSSPAGQWFLEADGPATTAELVAEVADAVQAAGGWPSKVTTCGAVKNWLRPLLAERGIVFGREHDLIAMACSKPPDRAEGRFCKR